MSSTSAPTTITTIGIDLGKNTFPAESTRSNEEMNERSAGRNHDTGCQNAPSRPFRWSTWMRADPMTAGAKYAPL